ncbi:MAG: hypothetical protein ED556_13610 [Winogradskyella sp.]|nr:MAG: hypothetical protein ED556_13610 [Winogradskyella sp.]
MPSSIIVKFDDNVNLPLSTLEKTFINEAYGDAAYKEIYSRPHRLKFIKQILRNRVQIVKLTQKHLSLNYPKLSEVPVFKSFNKTLKRDVVFNPNNFNPLKYTFSFYSKKSYTYQVDGTNYGIVIKSQYQ